jgi:catechol 2,3-dioxygenase-like lactoylglutathione lyase family enzyme
MQIDHVLYAVRDLREAAAWFESSFGFSVVGGGAHPGWGTANAVPPVGDGQYVELIGVVDPSSGHPLARALTALVSDGDRPFAVCLRPDDLDATARRLDLEVTDGARTNPDGVTLRWRMAGLEAALGPDRLPFFIEWPGGCNPELDDITERVGSGIAWVELGGDPDRLVQWVGEDAPTISLAPGGAGPARFALRRDGQTIVIGARSVH